MVELDDKHSLGHRMRTAGLEALLVLLEASNRYADMAIALSNLNYVIKK